MAYELKNGTGSLFKNNDKQKDTHADYRGDCMIDGKLYWMDAWIKSAQSGRTWMSFSFRPKNIQAPAPAPKPAERPRVEPKSLADMDDDVPF